ncbi:Hypothetical protein PBC10988_17460 [Planctomycetales bacterium 10988]|nr:Hypothetical protein PBC10988_17460 [Planctomycetales bacterium 10988]
MCPFILNHLEDPTQFQTELKSFVCQSFSFSRIAPFQESLYQQTLRVAWEMASEGYEVLPLGIIADVCSLASLLSPDATYDTPLLFSSFFSEKSTKLDNELQLVLRQYEDYVMGKLYLDASVSEAFRLLIHYRDRDSDRAIAFLFQQWMSRANLGGIEWNPAWLKQLQSLPWDEVHHSMEWVKEDSTFQESLKSHYKEVIEKTRDLGSLFGKEDLFELQHRTAIAGFSQRLALRQILHYSQIFTEHFNELSLKPRPRAAFISTKFHQSESYPTGGYASLSTRGSIESLLYSQLAYMEKEERPDLFDVYYLRNELLYYSRDENLFFRRRIRFYWVFHPSLTETRRKDRELPTQRIILLCALLRAAWLLIQRELGKEALALDFIFLEPNNSIHHTHPLSLEYQLIQQLFQSDLERGDVKLQMLSEESLRRNLTATRKSEVCHPLWLTCEKIAEQESMRDFSVLYFNQPLPRLLEPLPSSEGEELRTGLEAWSQTFENFLREWIE